MTSTVVCSYCLWRITQTAGERTTCPDCATTYHSDCFEENGGCGTFGCAAWLQGQNGDGTEDLGAAASRSNPMVVEEPATTPAAYCTSCGTALDADQRFCTSCGSVVQ